MQKSSSLTASPTFVKKSYYKVVKKDTKLVEDLINGTGVYMSYVEDSSNDGFYDIYLAATVLNDKCKQQFKIKFTDSNETDYYVGKFSTKYNYTEWYRQSRIAGINETVRGVHYDVDNQVVYVAVEIKTNLYMNVSTYDTFANTAFTNQTNVAIIAFDRYCM